MERDGFEGADLVTEDRAYIAANDRERARMRELVEGLDEAALRTPVNEHWTVAAVLAHIAFWDGRMLALTEKMDRGVPFDASDAEPEDVDWINDASRPLCPRDPAARGGRASRSRSRRRPTPAPLRSRSTGSGRATPTARCTRFGPTTAASTSTTSPPRSGR